MFSLVKQGPGIGNLRLSHVGLLGRASSAKCPLQASIMEPFLLDASLCLSPLLPQKGHKGKVPVFNVDGGMTGTMNANIDVLRTAARPVIKSQGNATSK